jgi:hypothetical protein
MKKQPFAFLGMFVLGISFCLAAQPRPFTYKVQPESNWRESYIPTQAGHELHWCGSSQIVILGSGGKSGFGLLDTASGAIERITVGYGYGHGRGYCSLDGRYLFTIKQTKPFEIGRVELGKKEFTVLETDPIGKEMFPFLADNLVSPDGRILMSIEARATAFTQSAKLTPVPVLSPEARQRASYSRVLWAPDSSALYLFGCGISRSKPGCVDILDVNTQKIVRKMLAIPGHNTVNMAKASPANDKVYVLGYPDDGMGGSNLYLVNLSETELNPRLLLENIWGFDVDPKGGIYFIKSVGETYHSEIERRYAKGAFGGVFYWREGKEIELIRKYRPEEVFDPAVSKDGSRLVFRRVRDWSKDDRGVVVLTKTVD